MKNLIKKILPPFVLDLYRLLRGGSYSKNKQNINNNHQIHWSGNYSTWEEAKKNSGGYDASSILEKIKSSTLKVKNGEAIYERDGYIFDEIQYSWTLLAFLLKIALENDKQLNVLDFGGSLGSSYFQNRDFLKDLKDIKWSVVEQKHFVDCGKAFIQDEQLKFYESIEECMNDRKPQVLLVSGTIQYVDKPYHYLQSFLENNFEYIIFENTSFTDSVQDFLSVQYVPEHIYKASFPNWFFNYTKFINFFSSKYELLLKYKASEDLLSIFIHNNKVFWKGLLFKKRTQARFLK